MLNEIRNLPILIRQYGFSRLSYRFYFDITRKTGLLKSKFSNRSWQNSIRESKNALIDYKYKEISALLLLKNNSFRFFLNTGHLPDINGVDMKSIFTEIENLKKGNFLYFSGKYGYLGYSDTEWLLNPFTKSKCNSNEHWIDLTDFNETLGDIKYIWEPSRFGWVYTLARAYAYLKDDEYPNIFWHLLESWMESNPPNTGPNWQCGQETAIRSFAVIFGIFAFSQSAATTELRLQKAFEMLHASAERIVNHIDYARIQMGNHAVSEAGALWSIGVLFPFLKNSEKWRKTGKFVLEDEVKKFNFPDGSYIQHSMNYQRLMLHVYLWCFRLAEINSLRFTEPTYDKIKKSYLFLYSMQDPDTGFTPNYGPNDGANILPLSGCDYPDFRPLIQAYHYFYKKKRIYDNGPYDEILLWFFGPDSLKTEVESIDRKSTDFLNGGYHTFRRKNSWGMARCHTYRSRPNQADMLHFDLWWKGINILRDSGTYSYYDPEDNWNHFFVSTRAHNTVEIGNTDQMIKGTRFRWYSLLDSKFHFHATGDEFEIWQGEHNGYKRLSSKAIHRRAVLNILDDLWIVVDDILGMGNENTKLIWNFPDVPYRTKNGGIILSTENGDAEITVKACKNEPEIKILYGVETGGKFGFSSLYYGKKQPTPVLVAEVYAALPQRYISFISLGSKCPDHEITDSSIKLKLENISTRVNLELGNLNISGACMTEVQIDNEIVWKNPK